MAVFCHLDRECLNMTYLILGSEVSRDEPEDYFIFNSGFDRQDAITIFNTESSEFLTENCPDLEIV